MLISFSVQQQRKRYILSEYRGNGSDPAIMYCFSYEYFVLICIMVGLYCFVMCVCVRACVCVDFVMCVFVRAL
jgi:hypothetical protein